MPPPLLDARPSPRRDCETTAGVRHSSRNLPLNDSSAPFCHGLPGSMSAVSMPASCSQRRMAARHELRPVVRAQIARRAVRRSRAARAPRSRGPTECRRRHRSPGTRASTRRSTVRHFSVWPLAQRVEDEVVRPDVIHRRSAAAAAAGRVATRRRGRRRGTCRPAWRHRRCVAIGAHHVPCARRGRSGCADSRSAGTAPANSPHRRRRPAHRAPPAAT